MKIQIHLKTSLLKSLFRLIFRIITLILKESLTNKMNSIWLEALIKKCQLKEAQVKRLVLKKHNMDQFFKVSKALKNY